MARLVNPPKVFIDSKLPEKEKRVRALQFLRDNPDENPITAARIWKLKKSNTLQRAWKRERQRIEDGVKLQKRGGQNRILSPEQHKALIRYAADHCLNGGKGATKQMMYNCAMWLRVKEGKPAPSWKWFQTWLRETPELHTIKTKPIASHRVDMHTEQTLKDWFETEYRPALEITGVRHGKNIHNMDEKGARVCMPAGEEVVVPIGIKEMYTGLPENRMSVTVVECISADGKAIPPVIIVKGVMIMASWFSENMTGHELITVSESGYTNEGICIAWLDHFIKHNDCGLDKEWHILLIDGATCHDTDNFRIKAKANKIWVVKFPSHQTHLLQPCDVGCFRQWKHWQQIKVMDAIRSFQPEYNLASLLRDLPEIREKTFTVRTIKHSFQDAGIWPVSFKAVKKKLKEYGKKKKKDTGLEFLEYGSSSSSDDDGLLMARQPAPIPNPLLKDEYLLPKLPTLPSSYNDCIHQWNNLNPKIEEALTSPSRARYHTLRKGTYEFLMLGSLGEMDLKNAATKQVDIQKAKLTARVSLSKGGSMLASVGLARKKEKEVKMAGEGLKKAKAVLTRAEREVKDEVYHQGVADRKEERERKKWVKEQQDLQGRGIAVHIPPEKLVPIRDREKQPSDEEMENIRILHQSLYDAISREQDALEAVMARDIIFFSDIPIDPALLKMETEFLVNRNPLSQTRIITDSDDEEEDDDGYIPSSPLGKMVLGRYNSEKEEGEEDMDICSSPLRSVATIDSFDDRNRDFLRFQ